MNDFETGLTPEIRKDVEILWGFHVVDSGPVEADVLLVLGSHDLRAAERAAELFVRERCAPVVITTGGAGKVTGTEWTRAEAEVYAERLVALGVPEDAILVEPRARNTGDNFDLSRELAAEKGLRVTSGVIVSKPYMARRSLAVALMKWPEPTWFTRPPQIPLRDYPSDEVPLTRMINLMVGDLQRLRVYADRGFQAPVDIPGDVWAAYERLVGAGYDEFLID
ncbi:YdcF family protein [Microbispora sp. ZYX-F-249]|uniref:YdcF family protein n=1 Tax=Microbispora maris TaxID=3144104 RepID=A0ABV0AQD9_9ACTN